MKSNMRREEKTILKKKRKDKNRKGRKGKKRKRKERKWNGIGLEYIHVRKKGP